MLQKVSSSPSSSSRAFPSDGADSPPEPTGAELSVLRNREPDAIERWVYGNRRIVYRLLLKMVKDTDVAEELLQETFYQALRSINRFRGDSKVSTWLCSIARNLAFRYFRDQDRYTTAESHTLEWMNHHDDSASSLADGEPRHHTERTERKELVHAALAELPDSYREVIRMRDLEEKSTEEVAEALDLTRVNVRVRLHRARQKLEDLLRPQFEDDLRRTGRLARAA
jgi:RNA polymerase sigma-70 factor (ECF subfamily)